jgi:negative regulator of flagellin synthesis FlgM
MANAISTLQGVGSVGTNGPLPVDGARQAAIQGVAAKSAAAAQTATVPTDKAHLSSLGGLVAQASAGSDVRLDKVAALQQAISSGTYNVPAKAVASKIVDSLLG